MASVTLGYEVDAKTGKHKRVSEDTYHHSEPEAQRWLDRANAQLEAGKYITPDRVTVGEFVRDWLENVIRPTKEPSTHTAYLKAARCNIIPHIGSVPLQKLTPAQVQGMLTRITSEGGSVAAVRYAKIVLGAALKQAVAWDLVPRNVASQAVLPSHRAPEMKVLSREEARTFLAATETHPLHAAFVIATVLGLRVGEYLSLRWDDLDLTNGTLRVRTTIQQVAGRGLLIKRTKSRASERLVHLPEIVTRALVARRDLQAGEGHADAAYIFTAPRGGLYSPGRFRDIFYKVRERAGVQKVRLHDLRHTAASVMLAGGVPITTVSKILGHKDPSVTLRIYAHVLQGMEQEAVQMMDRIWG